MMDSNEIMKKQAEARFKQAERALDGQRAMTEYETQILAIREKTAHLRALGLAKEAQDQLRERAAPKTTVRPPKNQRTR